MDADDGAAAAGQQALPDKPKFAPLNAGDKQQGGDAKVEFRRVPVPQHRMTPLKTAWMELYKPITDNLKLDMRMNLKTKKVRCKGVGDPWTLEDFHALCAMALGPLRADIWRTHPHALIQVEIKTTPQTTSTDALQKAADFVHAYLLGRCTAGLCTSGRWERRG